MKKNILTALALVIAAAPAPAQNAAERQLVVTDKNGAETSFTASDVQGIIFEDAPEYTTLTTQLAASYTESSGSGIYRIDLGTAPADINGDPANIGDIQVALTLRAPKTTDVLDPELPAGYFTLGNGSKDFTFDFGTSGVWIRLEEGADGIASWPVLGGSVDVRAAGNGRYDIRIEFSVLGGANVNLRYEGQLTFGRGTSETETFTEDQDITFTTQGQAVYWGNWYYPFGGDAKIELYEGNVADGRLTDGYILYLYFTMPRPANENAADIRIADGTYTADFRTDVVQYLFLPYRFDPGKKVDFLGQEMVVNTRLEYYGKDGRVRVGIITGGEFTVSGNGTKLEANLTTVEGINIKAHYAGVPVMQNFFDDSGKPARPYSTIPADREMKWGETAGTGCFVWNDGHTIFEDLNTVWIYITEPNMTKGDYMNLEIMLPDVIPADGVYPLSWNLANGNIIPGTVDYGGMPIFSWYGDLDNVDADGVQLYVSALASGTLTVSTEANGDRRLAVDFTDDAGKRITGTYVGPIVDITPDKAAQRRLAKKGARSARKVNTAPRK